MTLPRIWRPSALSAAVLAAVALTACNQSSENAETAPPTNNSAKPAAGEVSLETPEQKVTYIVGYNMAQQAQSNGLKFETDVLVRAIEDVYAEREPRIPQEQQREIMMGFQESQQEKRDAERKVAADANLKASQEFLEANKQKEGVQVTESGLQYKIVSEGPADGATPTEEDTVQVHYHGTLPDGEVFDSSVQRGQPVTFPVNGVIPGWVEALQLMSVGDKFELYIPPDLAYGENGTSGKIGPSQALIFEVELLAVNPEGSAEGGAEGGADPHGH